MEDGRFNNPSFHARIVSDVLRIQSELLEWSAEPTETDFDTKIVATLVDTLDVHARVYLEAVDRDSLPEYTNVLQRVGSALVQNAEQRSFLSDPYSDDRLRKLAESSGEYIQRKHSLTPEQQEAEIRTAVERIRHNVMQEALEWHRWKNQFLVRIVIRFEARYRHWTAEAFERVRHSQNSVQEAVATQSGAPVFISYSWDTEEHKTWVLTLATRLRENSIDAIIDQTHLSLGARSPEFMERSVRKSGCVLVVCTETYKRRFDNREGGAGYESHIITGEIINEVGENKFIPVLRSGDWKSAVPNALSGIHGVDLRKDSPDEYRRLVRRLHGISDISPVGPRPDWLDRPDSSDLPAVTTPTVPDSNEFFEQRKRLPDTEVLKKIWSKPRWHIWIRPTAFRRARFQNLEQCRNFVQASSVSLPGSSRSYPAHANPVETGDEWIAGEIDTSEGSVSRVERWALFRSGQFVHNRAVDETRQLAGRVHVLEILDTATAAFEFAARMSHRGVLSPSAVITFDLYRVDGLALTRTEDIFGYSNAVEPSCWCQDENLRVMRLVATDELEARRRELALEVALEIYSRFGWSHPLIQRLRDEQDQRFRAVENA